MEPNELEEIRRALLSWRKRLKDSAIGTLSDLINTEGNLADPLDRTTHEMGRGYLLRIRDRESRLLKKIELALDRLDSDEFGICEGCGSEISVVRLMVRPVTTYCIDCKRKMEWFEKAAGL